MTTTFADLGVNARLLTALSRNSIDSPVPVQVEAIPPMLAARDVVIQAPTGSGKTLAYMLPLVERLIAVGG
ncbi:MAG: DEAD/DEAH box helicase, partial [Chloroflexi bacterium]